MDSQEAWSITRGATVTKFGAGCSVIQAQVRAAKAFTAIDCTGRRTQGISCDDEGTGFAALAWRYVFFYFIYAFFFSNVSVTVFNGLACMY